MRRLRVTTIAVAALMSGFFSAAAAPAWNQEDNIKEAARHIALVHLKQGPQKAIEFIDACYRTHSLASEYSRAYEACIVRDFLLAQVLAAQYAQIPPAERQKRRMPEPGAIAGAMGQRVAAAFQQYNIPPSEADSFRAKVGEHGVPVFMDIAFPKSAEAAPEKGSKPGKKQK